MPAGLDPDAVVRIFIAIYQGLVLQTALDDGLDHDAFVRALASMFEALVRQDKA